MQQKNASEGTRKSTSKKKPEIAKAVSKDVPSVTVAKSSKTQSHVGESSTSKGHRRTPSSAKSAATHTKHESVSYDASSHQAIEQLAYSYWVSRGHSHGSAEEDWLRAERHLTSK